MLYESKDRGGKNFGNQAHYTVVLMLDQNKIENICEGFDLI